MHRVLAVDDERGVGEIISRLLAGNGYEVEHVTTGSEALASIRNAPNLVLLDINLPDTDGMYLLREMRQVDRDLPIVMMTAYGSVATAVQAIKMGAVDYIEKPFDHANFKKRISEILRSRCVDESGDCGIVGSSPQIGRVFGLIDRFALSDLTVLLHGESGTGKELFARAIHKKSKRRDGPFIPLDCAALTESLIESELFGHERGAFTGATERKMGRFERAHGGTLFIDEVENLSPSNQAKLLRAIQEREIERVGGTKPIKVDVRIIAATNRDLRKIVSEGRFREDLYYRLNQVTVDIPPLREREGDLELLIRHYLDAYVREFGKAVSISGEALAILKAHSWPGNVRELENVVKSATIMAEGDILPEHIPDHLKSCPLPLPLLSEDLVPGLKVDEEVEMGLIKGSLDLKALVRRWSESLEEAVIRKVMERSSLNMNRVAEFLDIDPKTLRSKIRHIRSSRVRHL
jgi:DNA-binding NtrC family response regulator